MPWPVACNPSLGLIKTVTGVSCALAAERGRVSPPEVRIAPGVGTSNAPGARPGAVVRYLPGPVTVLISPKEGLQATGHGMTYRPCYP